MGRFSYPVNMEIAGNTAMWTRPDSGDSPVSYPAPTYSAVKAIFESILWGPDIEIIPTKVELCSPVQYHSYHTNYGGPLRKPKAVKEGNNYQLYATVLIDVCYKLHAEVLINKNKTNLPEKALSRLPKYLQQETETRTVLLHPNSWMERVHPNIFRRTTGYNTGTDRHAGNSHTVHAASGIFKRIQIRRILPV